jgi:hypothetical protein
MNASSAFLYLSRNRLYDIMSFAGNGSSLRRLTIRVLAIIVGLGRRPVVRGLRSGMSACPRLRL